MLNKLYYFLYDNFINVFKFIRNSEREDFLKLLPQNSIGAELGVFKGEFSIKILTIVKPMKLYLIDVWWGKYGKFYPDWGAYTDHGKLETKEAYRILTENIQEHKDKCEIMVGDDQKLLLQFPDNYFDWVYIDSTHSYEKTVDELKIISTKIKPDGLITGHDWQPSIFHDHHGVYKAVREFCSETSWEIVHTDEHTQWCLQNSNYNIKK